MDTSASPSPSPFASRWRNTVEKLLSSLDPLLIGTIILPLGLVASAWALRMACAVCAVKVPDFLTAVAVVVVSLVANFGLRILLNHNDMALGLGSQLLLILLTSAVIIAFSVRTSIASALAVTITQVFFCGLMYFGATEVGQALLTT